VNENLNYNVESEISAIQPQVITSEVIKKIKEHQKIGFERFSNWIPVGSGNYEKTQDDGRYRDNCNEYRGVITCENHKIESLKMIFNHCNKLDCETCCIHAVSDRARTLNEELHAFQKEAKKYGMKTGNIIHIVFSPKKELALRNMRNYGDFLKFRRNNLFTMFRESGIFAGIVFNQLWSYKCLNCGKEERECTCEEKDLERLLNPHYHVVGFGYLVNVKEFRQKHEDWLYINHGRRKDAYHTIFYILSNVALWRKGDGKLKPSYQRFGFLKSNKFIPINEKTKYVTDRCPICKKPRKKILKGVEIHTEPEKIKDTLLSLDQMHNHTLNKEQFANKELETLLEQHGNKVFLINVSEKEMELGKEIKYKRIVREYKLLDVDGLRRITMRNKMKYRAEKRKLKQISITAGNGYG